MPFGYENIDGNNVLNMSRGMGTKLTHTEFWWEILVENERVVSQKGDAQTALR